MTKQEFLHWEASPEYSREGIKAPADITAGDLLVLTGADTYEVFKGSKLTPYSEAKANDIVIAIALEDCKKDGVLGCVVRNATVLIDKINGSEKKALKDDTNLGDLAEAFAKQGLVAKLSIEVNQAFK